MANSLGTLTPKLVTLDFIEGLKVLFPQLFTFGFAPTSQPVDFNQQVVARIPTKPSVAAYDPDSGGYQVGNAATTDVPVTLNKHKSVGLEFNAEEISGTKRNLVQEQISLAAFALGEAIFADMLALLTTTNFTAESVEAVADCDYDTLQAINGVLNGRGVMPFGRNGLVNTAVAGEFVTDNRLISKDYRAEVGGADMAYRQFSRVGGFNNVFEYPSLPDNSESLIGFFGTKDALALVTGVPKDPAFAESLGVPIPGKIELVTEPVSGITFMHRYHYSMQAAKLQMQIVAMWGVAVGVAANGQRLVHTSNA